MGSEMCIRDSFRTALSVAVMRAILTTGNAGQFVRATGEFVLGGNFLVGAVLFLTLFIVQFAVVTGGANRIAEVAARFTLDALPGKQMSIDADLSAGLITEEEARERRKRLEMEADFYGAMDGAAKFVHGDAITALLVAILCFIGGLLVGVWQRGESWETALRTYALLTVGQGLLIQIPALLVSAASDVYKRQLQSQFDGFFGSFVQFAQLLFNLAQNLFNGHFASPPIGCTNSSNAVGQRWCPIQA